MKKIILAVVLSILPLTIFAQGLISFGPKIGWNSNRLTTDYTEYMKDFKSGFQGGVFFSVYLHKFYVQPEAYFSIKRGALQTSFDPLNPNLNISQSVNLQSIDIPVLLGFKVLDLKLIRFRIWGGPVASYILSKEYTLSINGVNESEQVTRDDFKNAIWSAQIGAGLDLLMLTFDIGYEFGLNSFLTIRSLNDFNLRNHLFYCSIGWRLF
ncbi:MAG: PorT family protein [Porphyromonadaceae bacterium]|nr:MAG: PorT family protein [Porphyromonadaceae bacterium]